VINRTLHKIQAEDAQQREIKIATGRRTEADIKLFKPRKKPGQSKRVEVVPIVRDKNKCVIL